MNGDDEEHGRKSRLPIGEQKEEDKNQNEVMVEAGIDSMLGIRRTMQGGALFCDILLGLYILTHRLRPAQFDFVN